MKNCLLESWFADGPGWEKVGHMQPEIALRCLRDVLSHKTPEPVFVHGNGRRFYRIARRVTVDGKSCRINKRTNDRILQILER